MTYISVPVKFSIHIYNIRDKIYESCINVSHD
jgi:hypothetical protein